MKKPGSILRIKEVSESEDEVEDVEMAEDQAESASEQEEPEASSSKQKSKIEVKKRKKGIVYISSIPKHMNVAICREFLEQFGEVGRIFLQPDSKGSELRVSNDFSSLFTFFINFSDKESQQEEEECDIHRRLGGVREEEGRQMGRSAHQRNTDCQQERFEVLRYSLESQVPSRLQMDPSQREAHLRARRPASKASNRYIEGEKGGELLPK